MPEKIKLAILGATGMAGREALLHQHFLDNSGLQYAEITCVTASKSSAGRKLGEVVEEKEGMLSGAYNFWVPMECPESVKNLIIEPTEPEIIASKADYAISALGSDIAETIEPKLTKRGINVFSNASTFRWAENVPLIIPEANGKAIYIVKQQETPGKLVCNPNCTTAGYVPLIKALEDFGYKIKDIFLFTEQSISGKGDEIANQDYAERIKGNVLDDWTKDGYNPEEWKSACEPMKILGRVNTKEEVEVEREKVRKGEQSKIIPIYTQTTRVPTQYGHLEHLTIEFNERIDVLRIKEQLMSYTLPESVAALPTTPKQLFYVLDRMPAPKDDVHIENGMAVVVGDMQQHTPTRISISTLTHNLRRGATWAGRQGLELFCKYNSVF